MVTSSPEKCTACGLCVRICHESCMSLVEGVLMIARDICSTCTQCIAVCPRQALSWQGTAPAVYEPARLPRPEQLDELVKERRTVREFKDKKIERAVIEEIIGYAAYAPTHNFQLRTVAVDDDETLQLADAVIFRFIVRMHRLFFKPRIAAALMKRMPAPIAAEYVKAGPKLESSLDSNHALSSLPAALVFLVGDRRIPLSEASAQYGLYNITLYAQAKGIGARNLVGNQMILNRSREIRRRLGLAKHERIFGTVGLGYPSVRFSNKVNGRKLNLIWNPGQAARGSAAG